MKFRNEYWFLSNMYPVDFEVDNILYHSSENYYQAHKTTNSALHIKIAAVSPYESKKLGRKVALRDDWNSVKIKVMKNALFHKFSLNSELKNRLIATVGIQLIEDNTWNDTFWGVCNGKGANYLGELLSDLREKLEVP